MRYEALEKKLCAALSEQMKEESWNIFIKLDDIICDITETSDERLRWQAQHSVEN